MQVVYEDNRIIVAKKPAGVLSTDEPGGMPSLLRMYLNETNGCVRTVHRLDRTVSGLMVFARSRVAASLLSEQIRNHSFEKEYLAVVHGHMPEKNGTLTDLLYRDKSKRMTQVVSEPGKDVQTAVLSYQTVASTETMSVLRIVLKTGRTHQIRVQLSSRGCPIVGDRRYGIPDQSEEIALWSARIAFDHPETGKRKEFSADPPDRYPWSLFQGLLFD